MQQITAEPLPIRPLNHRIEAVVRPPGSKSITNRALVCAALAKGVSKLHGALEAEDTEAMRKCLRGLGVGIDDADDPWLVAGVDGRLGSATAPLNAGDSGTTARFLTAAAALATGEVVVDGSARMRERPIGDLVAALAGLGVHAEVLGRDGCPPVKVTGGSITGGSVVVDARRSSQFVSALLLVAPYAESRVALGFVDGKVASRTYVTTTIEVMGAFGIPVAELPEARLGVPTEGYRATDFVIEADASSAVYPLVAAAITGGKVAITGIPEGSSQPDLAVVEVLEEMGCRVLRGPEAVEVEGPSGPLRSIDLDLSDAPDGAMGLAVASLFGEGPSTIRGLSTLRLKETDRLAALTTELNRVGAQANVEGDAIHISPGALRAAQIQTYGDHRMAMAFSLIGLKRPGISIEDPDCVAKTWPGYFDMLGSL